MTDSVNTRELVLEMLIEINEKGQYSHLVLRDVLGKYQYLSKQERAFLTRVTEGTLEHLLEMDYILNYFSKTKVRKMKPLIRNLLRMGVYQLKYMDSIPNAAVCNEAVKLAKKHGFGQLSGFVNGVLRNVARNLEQVKYPDEENELQYLSVLYSMPEWIVKQWMDAYGYAKTKQICAGFFGERPLAIRTNLAKCSPYELKMRLEKEQVTVEAVENLPYAFLISGYDYLNALETFEDGLFYIQDVSSMMVAEYADVRPDQYVIDVCASPGGKSTHIAEKLAGTGMVEARDLTEYKVLLIEENIKRHGLTNMKAVCFDATEFDCDSENKADILVCDLPCSGLGVLGKKTDIRYKMSKEQQEELIKLQRKILSTVHSYVKSGGTLIYSTCTINKGENEENVAWFLQEYPEFKLQEQRQMFPGEVGNDGFFIAKLKRK